MEDKTQIKKIIEALLIVSGEGLSREDIFRTLEDATPESIDEAIGLLKEEYSSLERSFNIAEIAGKCRIVSKPEYMPWIGRLYEHEPERLSVPALETLAIIAYKQPLTRAEAEKIRGVDVGGVLKTLLEKELIEVRGRKDAVGQPLIYGTTEKFLQIFGLNSLDDLPQLRDFTEEDLEFTKNRNTVVENDNTVGSEPQTDDNDDALRQPKAGPPPAETPNSELRTNTKENETDEAEKID